MPAKSDFPVFEKKKFKIFIEQTFFYLEIQIIKIRWIIPKISDSFSEEDDQNAFQTKTVKFQTF